MAAVLDGSYRTRAGDQLGLLESDLVVAYGRRNRMAHGLSTDAVIDARFEDLEARLFYLLFSIIERTTS